MGLWPSTSWGNFTVGALTMIIGPAVLRPVLVGVVRAGYEVKDYATEAWAQARREAETIHAEARSTHETDAELQQLREEVARLKARRPAATT
jgi:hypothetical protein